jgi:hypothetical protein
MLRRLVMASVLLLQTTTSIQAEPAIGLSAVVNEGLFRVEASSGQAIASPRSSGELRLAVETRDVARGEVRLGRLGGRPALVIAASSLGSRLMLEPGTSRQPLVTLFDHLEKPDPRAAAEHLTVGFDYHLEESGELPFEVAKSGSLSDRDDNHRLLLRAQFSF